MKKLHVAKSPLTNRIYAGHVLKDGMTWASNKQDVTSEACAAVAQLAIDLDEITINSNGKPKYRIKATEIKEDK